MVDRQRRARVGRREAHRAARARLHREHRDAHLVARRAVLQRGEVEEVPQPRLARAAGDGHRHLRHEQRPCPLVLGGLAQQPGGAGEAKADADVVDQPLADGQPALCADAAAQQDPRRAVRARRQHHGARRAGRPPTSRGRPRARPRAARGRRACRRGSSGSRASAPGRGRRRPRSSAPCRSRSRGARSRPRPPPRRRRRARATALRARSAACGPRARRGGGRARSPHGSSRAPTRRSPRPLRRAGRRRCAPSSRR